MKYGGKNVWLELRLGRAKLVQHIVTQLSVMWGGVPLDSSQKCLSIKLKADFHCFCVHHQIQGMTRRSILMF